MKIWTLQICHRHGEDITVHTSRADADATLLSYVDQWWEKERGSAVPPADHEDRINDYFNNVEDEMADITEHRLTDEQVLDLVAQAVIDP